MDDLKKLLDSEKANQIKGKYVRDDIKADAYAKGIEKLEQMLKNGTLLAYRADDVSMPLYVHQIEIRWFEEENRLKGKEVGEMLACFDTMFFSREKIMNDTWILSSEIYKEA